MGRQGVFLSEGNRNKSLEGFQSMSLLGQLA